MLRTLLLSVAAVLLVMSAKADPVNNLTISVLQNPVPQSISDPCVICATNVGAQPAGFGFNNFDSTGNDSSFNLFSSNVTGAFANGDDINVTPYTSGQLITFLQSLADNTLTFGVAIDVNSTGAASEVLTEFRLIDLDLLGSGPLGSAILFDLSGSIPLPDIRNGNGKGDYLISGFDLSAVSPGDRLLFQASWDHAVDGGESFYLVPIVQAVEVPEPSAILIYGVGLIGAGGAFEWFKRRRRHDHQLQPALA